MKPHERIKRIIALDLSPSLKVVLLVLAYHGDKNDRCYPGMALLARESSLSIRQAQRAIKVLSVKGLIDVDSRQNRSNIYRLILPKTSLVSPQSVAGVTHNSSTNMGTAHSLCTTCLKYPSISGDHGKCRPCFQRDNPREHWRE